MSVDQLRVDVLFEGSTSGLPVQGFARDLDRVDAAAVRVNRSFDAVGRMATAALATAAASAVVGLGAALRSAADEAVKLEKGVREIGTLMGGLSKNEIRQMSKELGTLAVASGQAVGTLTKARYDIVSAGFGDAAKSLDVLNTSARLAVAGVAEVSVTADLLTTTLNAYRRPAEDAADVSDDLFTIVRNGKTTMTELGSSMGALIATAGPLDVSLDEVGAALSTLTANGQNTAMASTAISAAILEMSKPSDALVAALAAVGVESENLIETGGGLAGAMALVQKASEGTGISVNKLVQREEALRAVLPLTSVAAEKFSGDLASMSQNAGAADKAFGEMAESADFLGKQTSEAFGKAQRAIGGAIIESEMYRESLVLVRDFFVELTDAFEDAADGSQRSGSSVTTAIVSIGEAARWSGAQLSWMWQQIGSPSVSGLGNAAAAFGAHGGFLNPFGSIPAALEQYNNTIANEERKRSTAANAGGSSVLDAINRLKKGSSVAGAPPGGDAPGFNGGGGGTSGVAGGGSGRSEVETAFDRWWSRTQEEAAEAAVAALMFNQELFAIGRQFEELGHILQDDVNLQMDQLLERTELFGRDLSGVSASLDSLLDNRAGMFGMPETAASIAFRDEQYGKKVEGTTSAIYELGYQLEDSGISIRGWDSFAQSYESLAEYFSPANQSLEAGKNYAGLYKGVGLAVSGIGQAIGGSIGDALSSTASLALAGLSAAGPIGAVVGGVVGLASSLFGGGSDDRANRDNMRRQIYDNMVQSALSGGTESLELLRLGGYDYDQVKNIKDPGYPGMKAGTSGRLFQDRGEKELQDLQEALSVLDQAGQSMQQFAKPQLLRDLETAAVLYEYSVATVGDLAELTEAYQAQLIMAITGVSADTLQSAVLDAIDNNSAADAGAVFVEKYEEGIKASIRNMAVSQMVSDMMMPALTPILQGLTASMMAGDYSAESMSAYLAQAMTVMDTLSPAVTALATAFDAGGVSIGYAKTVNASDYSTAAEYRRALAGIPGYADGGEMQAGWKIVGERSWELMHTGPGRVISNADSTRMLDNRPLAGQIEQLRREMQQSQDTLERHVSNLYDLFDRWRQDDFTVKVS